MVTLGSIVLGIVVLAFLFVGAFFFALFEALFCLALNLMYLALWVLIEIAIPLGFIWLIVTIVCWFI